jgi:hypothetical protein
MVSFFTTFRRTGLLFGFVMALIYTLLKGWQTGLTIGLLSGTVFGFSMAVFVHFQSKKFTQNRPLLPDEKLVKEGPANHKLKSEATGGWIYLTDSRLFFVSHKINLQNHNLAIPLAEIGAVEKGKSFTLIPNQLQVNLKNGQIERFIVNDVKSWINEIEKLL